MAGCVGSDATSNAAPPPTSAPPATVTEEFGSITGTVVTDEQAPLAGVDVAVIGSADITATTDVEGRFTLNELLPGAYKVAANKLGYESVAKSASVVAGEVTSVTFVLTAIAISAGYYDSIPLAGFYNLGIATPVVTVRPGYITNEDTERSIFDTNVTKGQELLTVVDAMVWESSAPLTAKVFNLNLRVDGSGVKVQKTGKSPIELRFDEPKPKKGGQINHWTWVYPSGTDDPTNMVAVVYQQKFTLYVHQFYGEEAPEDFSGLPPA